ncbi:hypothetical protein KUF71_018377 [Frankliniella fusca]|uniref:Uncharacterized protein n=1 Tax=Frankliniella fusca TaxID=407009 RepID=A0AAE1GRZ6_9NEOP|nr:hypothetical protein KUF71_018377 [Frankliniella fusca]
MTIKTVEKNEGPVLIAQTKCLICSENIYGYRSASSSWTMSNIYRHFMKHKEKKDHLPGTVLQSFFQPGNEKSVAAGTETRNSEEEDGGDLIEMEESNKSVGGRMIYEFLQVNLPGSLPSISQVELMLKNASQPVIEGVFRFQELVDFLMKNNLPLKVAISEDGTRVQEKFCYDSTTNQIIGPVLALNDDGIPIPSSHPATSAAMIASHLRNGRVASNGYAIMAQPLQKGAPSFCLTLFGTDNKFSAVHISKRWNFIHKELGKLGVEVINFASDGDPKLLKAMHAHLFGQSGDQSDEFYFEEKWKDWFFASSSRNFNVMQDPIHTINKFRARLNPSTVLPLGKYVASQTHLKILIKNIPQEEHGLTDHDLEKDKMNFNASIKMCSERVTTSLQKNVTGSEGTIAYLTSMRFLLQACLDEALSAAERLYNVWYCVFFLRFWKVFLFNHASYNMNNFVTSNLYVCVEIIAHTITMLIVKFREESTPEYFLVELLGSQPCEGYFRLARSMTSTQSTVINFCMKEFLARVKRIDVLNLVSSKLSEKLVFPRERRKKLIGMLTKEKLSLEYLPNNDEILKVVNLAKSDIVLVMNKLGVKCFSLVHIKQYLSAMEACDDLEDNSILEQSVYSSVLDEDDISLDLLAAFPSPEDITDLNPFLDIPEETILLPPTSIFLMVPTSNGRFVKMRKSTFCWLLSKNGLKLSSDRMLRVRQGVCFTLSNFNSKKQAATELVRKASIKEGDWCIFRKQGVHCIGQVLSFTYLSGSGAARTYTLPSVPPDPPQNKATARGVGCMCSWYKLKADRSLAYKAAKIQGFINIENYVSHLPAPTNIGSQLFLSTDAFTFFTNLK